MKGHVLSTFVSFFRCHTTEDADARSLPPIFARNQRISSSIWLLFFEGMEGPKEKSKDCDKTSQK